MTAVLELEGITKIYRSGDAEIRALQDVSLRIDRGDSLAILGPSGSGKSTLLHLLGCLDQPTTGRYLLDGRDVARLDRDELAAIRNDTIGFVFQGFNLLPRASALENVELPLVYAREPISREQRRRRALQALERVGLIHRAAHLPNELSGGQQQRVAIARALVPGPAVLLADEPTGNLDTRTGEDIMALFRQFHADGLTLVMVTHEQAIADHCRRQVVMRDGRILRDSVPERGRRDAHRAAGEPAVARAAQ